MSRREIRQRALALIRKEIAIIQDIKKGKIEPGLQFANYNFGSNQNVHWHLKYVADLCGFDVYANEKDELTFGRFLPSVPAIAYYQQWQFFEIPGHA